MTRIDKLLNTIVHCNYRNVLHVEIMDSVHRIHLYVFVCVCVCVCV